MDIRLPMLIVMLGLLVSGVWIKDFTIRSEQIALTYLVALLTQGFWILRLRLPVASLFSAAVTASGLSLLLRSDSLWVHPAIAALAISSKFLLRWNGKHVFNPANLGVILALLFLPGAWSSPGQWGHEYLWAAWLVAAGSFLTRRVRRIDISWAFLLCFLGLVGARVLWLGQRPAVWTHQFDNGALLLFAFFMISDPRTSPNHAAARLAHAACVAGLAFVWQFVFWRQNGPLWALFFLSPLVPLWDRLFQAPVFQWEERMRGVRLAGLAVAAGLVGFMPGKAQAFCGFYVAKADAALYNKASKVVLVRNENKNVISMMNDYQGDLKEFAIVVPVPAVLEKGQVNVGDKVLFDRIDAYSAPRLVEYFDDDPCNVYMMSEGMPMSAGSVGAAKGASDRAKALGVTVESQFTVGEYDISILSARESDGLETWLLENGYKLPAGASKALKPYVKQKLKFFVARVNLAEQAKTGLTYLRPLQFAYEYDRFMLPIRLGMLNARGPQDLLLFVLTQNGRVETTNYRTIKIPANLDIPAFVRNEFGEFYKSMFEQTAKKEGYRAVFTEHFWDMSWCDPCAADPLSPEELRKLGVFWVKRPGDAAEVRSVRILPPGGGLPPPAAGLPVMLTRLHIRYTPETFPEDLMFQETKDRENFQGRYVLRHPWKGSPEACEQARSYFGGLKARRESEARNLARLTGWEIGEIRKKMGILPGAADPQGAKPKWWENMWN